MDFLTALLSRDRAQSHERPLGPLGMSIPGPMGEALAAAAAPLLTSQHRDIQQAREPLFLALPFLLSCDTRSEPLPWVRKKVSRDAATWL